MEELISRQGKSILVEKNSIIIKKKGWIFAAAREKTIPIRNISSVEVKKPGFLAAGFIQFSIAGGATRDSSFKFSGGAFDAAQDENSVVFVDEKAYRIALEIKEYIENYSEAIPNKNQDTPNFSSADEIIKLKNLMDQGIITKEDFERKKQKILAAD